MPAAARLGQVRSRPPGLTRVQLEGIALQPRFREKR